MERVQRLPPGSQPGRPPNPSGLKQARALEPLLSDRTEGCLSDVMRTPLRRRSRGRERWGGRKWAEGNPTPRPPSRLSAGAEPGQEAGSGLPLGQVQMAQVSSLLSCPLGTRAASVPESRKDGGGQSPSFCQRADGRGLSRDPSHSPRPPAHLGPSPKRPDPLLRV